MERSLKVSTATLILAFLLSCTSTKTATAPQVCQQLRTDLDYIHHSMQANLSVYQIDPSLRERADAAHAAEMERAQQCSSATDYVRGIDSYFASFRDPHIKPWWQIRESVRSLVRASLGVEPKPGVVELHHFATGIIVKKIGSGYYVRAIDPKLHPDKRIAIGDELKACDGKSPSEILLNDILPYDQISNENAGLYNHAEEIFYRWDRHAGSTSTCTFSHDGAEYSDTLEWAEVDGTYLSRFPETVGPTYSIEKTPYGHWLKLRSLAGYGEGDTKLLKQFVADAKTLRKDKIIVLDLRGNSGGTSSWGMQWIRNLYGYGPNDEGASDLIFASPGNIAHYERVFELLDKSGGFSTSQDRADFLKVIDIMRTHPNQLASLEEGTQQKSTRKRKPVFHGKIYAVSDARVFSSGELFLQLLRLMPGVIQVGIASDASTQAGDIRFDQTPNGLVFSLGTKVFRSIFVGRKPGEPLKPAIEILPIASREFHNKDSMREQIEKIIAKAE